jgi:hypothetical protein
MVGGDDVEMKGKFEWMREGGRGGEVARRLGRVCGKRWWWKVGRGGGWMG